MNDLRKIAVVGASGFVGSRVVEMFHLGAEAEIIPVVHRIISLPRLSRFDLPWKFADARDVAALSQAFAGCDVVVHCVVGDAVVIEAAAKALLPAAAKAGVRRVIYISTASVHGQNPVPGTTEESPLDARQEFAYNNAKVRAESYLIDAWKSSGVELVMLRPSVVFGPRDRWITTLVGELVSGTAWLINEGRGVCNSIYVDNLVHAIRLAVLRPAKEVNGRAFLVGDSEAVSWADLYQSVALKLGLNPDCIHRIEEPRFPVPGLFACVGSLKSSGPFQALLPLIPASLKRGAKGFLRGWNERPSTSSWRLPVTLPGPRPSPEMVALQKCSYRFPGTVAQKNLGYEAPVRFNDGLDRTLDWMEWCGLAQVRKS